jgi:ribosomal protein S18 acetylase RimI-like enzyme
MAPAQAWLQRRLAQFDWEARSRVIEDGHGRIVGSVLVVGRPTPDGVLSTLYIAGPLDLREDLGRWGLTFSRAAGANVALVFAAKGQGQPLARLGLQNVRPWWRMDRSLARPVPAANPPRGYRLVDGTTAQAGSWESTFNRAFADHWRFKPWSQEMATGSTAELSLLAVSIDGGEPAAITIAEVETYPGDPRPQPVGLVAQVGTVPEHRRRGLASWLVTEVLRRLRDSGARSASLYVDGFSQNRAHDAYQKVGFEVAFESEVWEATFP